MFEGKDNAVIINYKSSSPLPAMKVLDTEIMKQERYECDRYNGYVVMEAVIFLVGCSPIQCFRLSLFF
jgi:hypothetical protein